MTEEWRRVPAHSAYEVSSLGRVRRGDRVLRGGPLREYWGVGVDGKTRSVHRLVAEAFLGACPDGHEVAHRNGDARDNRPENLTYLTHLDNMRMKHSHGTMVQGERVNTAKLTEEQVAALRRRYSQGESVMSISRTYPDVSYNSIWYAATRRTWKHVA